MDNIVLISMVLLWLIVLFNLFLTLALVRRAMRSNTIGGVLASDQMLEIGSVVPDFVAETFEGKSVTHADFAGQEYTMVFISPGCVPCQEVMPTLDELYPKAKQANMDFLILSQGEATKLQEYANTIQFSAPILTVSANNTLFEDYKVAGTPFYYSVDKKGKVRSGGYLDNIGPWKRLTDKLRQN